MTPKFHANEIEIIDRIMGKIKTDKSSPLSNADTTSMKFKMKNGPIRINSRYTLNQ